MKKIIMLVIALIAATACAASAAMLELNDDTLYRLYCGAGNGPAAVSEKDMAKFADEVITPLFERGFNIEYGVKGQWKIPSGKVIKEDNYIVNIVVKNSPETHNSVKKIGEEYVKRFAKSGASLFMTEMPLTNSFQFYTK
ncbi:MAG: DUF3574 domain-containing protein [Cloacibacillus sp.]